MKSVDRLVAEHDVIERALNLLERAAARIQAGQSVPLDFVRWAPGFFRDFADRCHHAKEEDVFFPRLKERGIPEQGGPIGVMLHEHELGRDCVGRMRAASQAEPFDAPSFAQAAGEYIPLLRQHIFKENNILFRMAERVLTDADDRETAARFSQVEQERGMSDWSERYGVEVAAWEASLPPSGRD